MTAERRYDSVLEEVWSIKREIASEYATLDDYFKGMLEFQEESRRQGRKFVSFPARRPIRYISTLSPDCAAKSVRAAGVNKQQKGKQ